MQKTKSFFRITLISLFIFAFAATGVFAESGLPVSSAEQNSLTLTNCSDKVRNKTENDLKNYKKKEAGYKKSVKKLKNSDKKVKASIKKLKKKAKTKKNKKKLKTLNAKHKTYQKKITSLNKKIRSVRQKIKTAQDKINSIKTEEPFIRVSGDKNGKHFDNLINYTVIPKGSTENISIESAEPNLQGEYGEMRGRKTVVEYVKNAADISDEVIAVNGQAWGGPWATEECTYDAEKKEWHVPETEAVGGWQYATENPNYEEERKYDEKASKTIGRLPYSKKYADFRICLCGMMKKEDFIFSGSINDAHKDWIAFRKDSSFTYGSNANGEIPGDEFTAAVSGARIINNGKFVENGWASGGPKTIIGTRSNGDIVLVSTVGRIDGFHSFSPREHCEIMSYLGCDNALCMDGGGSTSMVYKFRDSDKVENIAICGKKITSRPVANAVLFYLKDNK